MQLEAVARTDPGPVRDRNEDYFSVDVEAGLFLVADGMGGHASGEVASAIAVETVREILLNGDDPEETDLDLKVVDPQEEIRERLRYSMNQASLRIRKVARENPAHRGMGTTLAVLLVEGDVAHLGHVGDSRIYLFRDGRLTRLTRDHTVVQQEIDAGRLTPELARVVHFKNVLTQSIGYHGPVEPDTSTRPLRQGDTFVICSDGLTDPLDDEQIGDVCGSCRPEDLADELVRHALERGGDDNVTVVVLHVTS